MPDRILIVEDEDSSRFAIQDYFRSCGYVVDGAADRREAEAKLADHRYSLVITDLRLGGTPNQEGLDVISSVRSLCSSARIFLLTAFGSPEVERQALSRGADRLLEKDMPLAEIARIALDTLSGRHDDAALTGGE